MSRHNDLAPDAPRWLIILRQPRVMDVLIALTNTGPARFVALNAASGNHPRQTAQALRCLAAWRMCRRTDGGSWDTLTPETSIGLTDRGWAFACTVAAGGKLAADLRSAQRRRRHRR